MRKMKKWLALMVAGMMTVGLMGCSGSSDEGKKESGSDKADMKAAVVFGLGGLGDQSYNDLAYEGICFCYFVWNVVRFSRFLSFNCSE